MKRGKYETRMVKQVIIAQCNEICRVVAALSESELLKTQGILALAIQQLKKLQKLAQEVCNAEFQEDDPDSKSFLIPDECTD